MTTRKKSVDADLEETTSDSESSTPGPEAKAARCDRCDKRFVPEAGETTCSECADKVLARKASGRSGYVKCFVKGDGLVAAEGLKGGKVCVEFRGGEVGEFLEADVKSLPGVLVPID